MPAYQQHGEPRVQRNPVAEKLEKEVHKIEAKLKAMGLPVPKPQPSPAAQARAALAELAASQPIKPTSPSAMTRPSTAATTITEGGSLPSSPPNHAHRHGRPGSLPALTAEQELASYLTLKPPKLSLNLRGREVNGRKKRPPPSPPPPPTPPPLTMVERLDHLLTEVAQGSGSPMSSRAAGQGPLDVPAWLQQPGQPVGGDGPQGAGAQQQQQLPYGGSATDDMSDRAPGGELGTAADNASTGAGGGAVASGSGTLGGDGGAAVAIPEWAQGMPRGWSPLTDVRAWSAIQATSSWVSSPMQLRGNLLADLGEQEKLALRAHSRSPAGAPAHQGYGGQGNQQQQAGGGQEAAARPSQRVEQAVESVVLGAIPLRAARPEQVVTLRERSEYLTNMFPADPYSRDPVRLALLAQSAAAVNMSLSGAAVPGSLLGDVSRRVTQAGFTLGPPGGEDALAGVVAEGGGAPSRVSMAGTGRTIRYSLVGMATQGELAAEGSGAALAAEGSAGSGLHLDPSLSLDLLGQRASTGLTLTQSAVQAILEATQGASTFSPRASRRGNVPVIRRAAQPLSPDLQASLAPGQPVHVLSRLVTPVRKPLEDGARTSPHSKWGRQPRSRLQEQ